MNKARWFAGPVMAWALLAGGAGVAQAQFQPSQNYPQEQDDLAQSPAEETQDAPDDRAGAPRADDDFSDVIAADQGRTDSNPRDDSHDSQDDRADAAPADRESDEAMTNCALAAREEAERDGGYAEVRQVQEPRETRDGYDVEGDVDVRTGWRVLDGTARHFTCSVRNGRIADVYFRGDRAAR